MLVSIKNKRRLSARITTLILTLLICLMQAVPVLAFNIPKQTAAFYVNDTADLLSTENENYIIAANEDLNAKTGAQVVVVTIPNLDGASIEEYSNELFRSYGIGDAKKNNGVLILLSLEDRECRIEVGYGLEGAINDAKAGRIMDIYMIPYFKEGKWDEGMINGFDAVLDEIAVEYGIEIEHNEAIVPAVTETEEDDLSDKLMWEIAIAAAIALVAGLIIGHVFELQATVPTIIFLIIDLVILCFVFTLGFAILAFLFSLVTCGIGWAITSPDLPGSSGGSYYSSSYSSSSRSSSSSSSSYHSGGGGSSGGGGASRKF